MRNRYRSGHCCARGVKGTLDSGPKNGTFAEKVRFWYQNRRLLGNVLLTRLRCWRQKGCFGVCFGLHRVRQSRHQCAKTLWNTHAEWRSITFIVRSTLCSALPANVTLQMCALLTTYRTRCTLLSPCHCVRNAFTVETTPYALPYTLPYAPRTTHHAPRTTHAPRITHTTRFARTTLHSTLVHTFYTQIPVYFFCTYCLPTIYLLSTYSATYFDLSAPHTKSFRQSEKIGKS